MSFLEELKENFSKQPIIIRILYFLLLISFIYDIVTGNPLSIFFSTSLVLLIIASAVYWFKKEE